MDRDEFVNLWKELSETEYNIPCSVSGSEISGNGEIIDGTLYANTLTVSINGVTHEIPYYGVSVEFCNRCGYAVCRCKEKNMDFQKFDKSIWETYEEYVKDMRSIFERDCEEKISNGDTIRSAYDSVSERLLSLASLTTEDFSDYLCQRCGCSPCDCDNFLS